MNRFMKQLANDVKQLEMQTQKMAEERFEPIENPEWLIAANRGYERSIARQLEKHGELSGEKENDGGN